MAILSPEEQELKILENKRKKKESDKNYYERNKDSIKEKQRDYVSKNYEKKIKYSKKNYRLKIKAQAMDLLGGCKCVICGETELNYLTIDHINNTGYLDKKSGVISHIRYRAIINGKYPREDMLNLRILCWNHNCGRRKEYLDMPWKKQSKSQRHQTKLWKEALDFFGPCSCGNMDLKHLTISHINNDGAERRKGGEKFGSALLTKFRQLGWPESLKEDYCLECFNCNCGRNSIS